MTGIDERVSLSQKTTLTLLRFRTTTVSSLLLLSTDIRKIQNKSGEPETVENTRWRIMIRCDEAFVFPLEGKKKRERFKICALFFPSSSIRYPTRKATARTKTNASLERKLTA